VPFAICAIDEHAFEDISPTVFYSPVLHRPDFFFYPFALCEWVQEKNRIHVLSHAVKGVR
jgi:hypothetical protein